MKIQLLFFLVLIGTAINAQITPAEAGYVDAVADYGADNTGKTVTTAELQNAIDGAISQNKPLFIPAGTYLIDNTLVVENDTQERSDQNVFITGSGVNPANRTILLLKAGTFPDAVSPGHVILHKGWKDEKYTDTFNRMLQSIDIKIEENNAGAIGLRWRGAEGVGIFDVNIDVTGGLYGMDMIPGSGGSIAKMTVTGGKVAFQLTGGPTQPTPTITHLTLRNQEKAGFETTHIRGALTLTGCKFYMKKGIPVFDLRRHPTYTWSAGGNPVLTDCVIEYDTAATSNVVFKMHSVDIPSVHFSDVYVKNASKILETSRVVNSNPNGWRYFREMAFNSGWQAVPEGNETIYIDGEDYGSDVYEDYTDAVVPPSNIQTRHGWGESFPGFESAGAVDVTDYDNLVDNGDWAPAFNKAISDAASGSNVVFVPRGDYIIYNTIHLQEETKLVGCGFRNSRILGGDMKGRRFGGSTSGRSDPKPMIDTPDDNNATCLLADITVAPYASFNAEDHTPEALACYSLLWRAGKNSVIRNIDYMRVMHPGTRYRAAFALEFNLTGSKWLSLKSIPSPSIINGFEFTSDCAHSYHIDETVPSRILVETVNNNKRIMTRSLPPARFNATETTFKIPNLTIAKEDKSAFRINSLKITNGAWDPAEGDTVVIKGFGEAEKSKVVPLTGISREELITVELNWENITRIEIISEVPFSLDDAVLDNSILNFENLQGSSIKEGVDYRHQCSGYGYMYLPMYIMAQPYVKISGGCKYYNHWIHGSTWLKIDQPYVLVKDNDPDDIVSFYHCHAQHSQNFYKLKFENAHNVSVFGIKTENALEFIRAENSENIRIMGHGGLTNPPKNVAHYRFENCTDFQIVSPGDEVWKETSCSSCAMGDVMLPRTYFGSYDDIQEIHNGKLITPEKTHSPILYMRGNPHDPWGPGCETSHDVKVENGFGSGAFCAGQALTVRAEIPECGEFSHWTGDTTLLDDPFSAVTSFIMPDSAVSFTAQIEMLPLFELEVLNGLGSGEYCEGTEVMIEANAAPADSTFDKWTGNGTEFLDDSNSASATLIQPGFDVTLTAAYKKTPRYFSGEPFTIPGKINLEEYDVGGEGETYHDVDDNLFDFFRTEEGVDIGRLSLADYFVASARAGEWMEYSINATGGTWFMEYTFASEIQGWFHLELNGEILMDSIPVRATEEAATFASNWLEGIELPEGEHILRLVVDEGNFNLNFIQFCTDCAPFYTVRAGGINGTVAVQPQKQEYLHGEVVELNAEPDEGYRFVRWSYDLGGEENPAQLLVDSEKTVRAVFEPATAVELPEINAGVKVYPNPATENVFIETTEKNGRISIINAAGIVIKQQTVSEPITAISLSKIPGGHYTLRFSAKNKTPKFHKLIVL